MPKHASHRLRLGRESIIGASYHLRFSCMHGRRDIQPFLAARAVIQSLRSEQRHDRADTLCFCIMPDHVHWLMTLRQGDLSNCVRNVKRLSQRLSPQKIQWQVGYFDHRIRDEIALQNVARYIVANPLRAQMVKTVRNYPHWDAVWL